MYEINNLTFRYMLSDRNSLEQVSLKIKKSGSSKLQNNLCQQSHRTKRVGYC